LTKLLPYILSEKNIYISAQEIASPANQQAQINMHNGDNDAISRDLNGYR